MTRSATHLPIEQTNGVRKTRNRTELWGLVGACHIVVPHANGVHGVGSHASIRAQPGITDARVVGGAAVMARQTLTRFAVQSAFGTICGASRTLIMRFAHGDTMANAAVAVVGKKIILVATLTQSFGRLAQHFVLLAAKLIRVQGGGRLFVVTGEAIDFASSQGQIHRLTLKNAYRVIQPVTLAMTLDTGLGAETRGTSLRWIRNRMICGQFGIQAGGKDDRDNDCEGWFPVHFDGAERRFGEGAFYTRSRSTSGAAALACHLRAIPA